MMSVKDGSYNTWVTDLSTNQGFLKIKKNISTKAFCARPLMNTTLNYAVNKLVFEVSENPVLHCPVITPARGHVTAAVPRDCTPHYKAGYKVAE